MHLFACGTDGVVRNCIKRQALPLPFLTRTRTQFRNLSQTAAKMTPIITLEEHVSPCHRPYPTQTFTMLTRAQYINAEVAAKSGTDYSLFPEQLVSKLGALGQTRIDDMDASNISMQILSHAPIDASLSQSIEANDQLAFAISKNPTRLAGFALLPMAEPEASADELTRCVKEMGFVGALLDNHLDGVFYDDEKFWPVFAKAEELDVPLYLHPTFASERMMEGYRGNYGEKEALALSAFGWGWHSETALHVLKLFAAGLFDRFPKLKIVIGHVSRAASFPFQYPAPNTLTRWANSSPSNSTASSRSPNAGTTPAGDCKKSGTPTSTSPPRACSPYLLSPACCR